jgi:S1-C subfamily serine protease
MAAPGSVMARVCASCGRRVIPPSVMCRCGKSVEGVALTPVAVRAQPAPPPDTTQRENVVKALILIVGLSMAGFMIYRARLSSRVVPKATKVAVQPASSASAPAAARPPAPVPVAPIPAEPITESSAPPSVASEASQPTALERVMAAAEASKRAQAASGNAVASPAAASAGGVPSALEDVISRAMPAVVRIETSTSVGSGFFIAPDTMLTNVHVVGSNTTVTVRRADGKTMTARVDSTAPEFDIAVIKLGGAAEASQMTLAMASTAPRPGQEVIALGTPLGLSNTVTRGIVSAVRQVGGITLVQTDAAINPGNSGGPLLDRTGEVIGITTMAMKSSEAQGLGFAVGIEHARALLAGKRSADQHGTPISTLNDALSGRSAPDPATARDRATKTYEQTIATLARRANDLDQQWTAFKRICYKGPVLSPAGSHEWFAIWDPKAMQGMVPQGCTGAFNDIRTAADGVRDGVAAANEAARQGDVYPATCRDLLQRYRLIYPGWDR